MGITELLETVKSSTAPSDSSMMLYLAAQESARKAEMGERRKERELERSVVKIERYFINLNIYFYHVIMLDYSSNGIS